MDGWTCPKCGRVWAPSERECVECNAGLNRQGTQPFVPYTPEPWTPSPMPYTPSPAPWAPWVVWTAGPFGRQQ